MSDTPEPTPTVPPADATSRRRRSRRQRVWPVTGRIGAALILLIALPCFLTLPWSFRADSYRLNWTASSDPNRPPSWSNPGSDDPSHPIPRRAVDPGRWFGTDVGGRSLMWRCLLGGAVSLTIGLAAAAISVFVGVAWGAVAGYAGGRVDNLMMRVVDVLYGLPYILLVVLVNLALEPLFKRAARALLGDRGGTWISPEEVAVMCTLIIAIGGVSWLTMARVIRGQVLSLRSQPFVEAARAAGAGPLRILRVHLLPNLVGPVIVYMTLTVPSAILQESFLSFLGIGVQAPMPSWGNLVSEGLVAVHQVVQSGADVYWWLFAFPCALLASTLLGLNFLGDGLRSYFDPRAVAKP